MSRRTLLTVTLLPRSSSRPVPCLSIPNVGETYHWVAHGCVALAVIASLAVLGLSPSETPSGPNAATDATESVVTGWAGAARLVCAAALDLAAAALALA